MLTAARLVAALCFALLGFVVSEQIKPLMPGDTQFGYFSQVNAAIGFIVGWLVVGRRAGRGGNAAIGNGLTGAAALTFWGLFIQAGREALRLTLDGRYREPVEAVVSIFQIGIEYFVIMATPTVLGTLAIGGIIGALIAEKTSRHWR